MYILMDKDFLIPKETIYYYKCFLKVKLYLIVNKFRDLEAFFINFNNFFQKKIRKATKFCFITLSLRLAVESY